MKNLINKYFNIGRWFDRYAVYADGDNLTRDNAESIKHKWKALCIFDKQHYWSATREYKGGNPLDLFRIFRSEIKTISPFKAKTFWKVNQLSFTHINVTFYCMPWGFYQSIANDYLFFMPIDICKDTEDPLTSSLNLNKASFQTPLKYDLSFVKSLPVYKLFGLYSKNAEETNQGEKFDYRSLAISFTCVTLLFILVSSTYLSGFTGHIERNIAENKMGASELIKLDRDLKVLAKDLASIKNFVNASSDPITFISSLGIDQELTEISRFQMVEDNLKIYGETKGSATKVFEVLVSHPDLEDVKFSSPVRKDRKGNEKFVIEARKISG